jgi:hypothetical protein
MRLPLAIGAALLPVCSAVAQNSEPPAAANAPPVAFSQVATIPIPLQSTSGRFSSLNPRNQTVCFTGKLIGRVVSPRLMAIKVPEPLCGLAEFPELLVNVELANPADTLQMITGRRVVIAARFKTAQEARTSQFTAQYLIAEKAELVSGDPRGAAAPAFMSYMLCQAPELDGLVGKLGRELCVQSTLVANLTVTGPALEAAARAPADVSPEDAVPGDPDTISCRLDPRRSDRQLPAVACARGSYWAWYKVKWINPLLPGLAPP